MDHHPDKFELTLVFLRDHPEKWVCDHVQTCKTCQAVIETFENNRAEFQARFNTEEFVERVFQRAERQSAEERFHLWGRSPWQWGSALAAAAVLLIAVCIYHKFPTLHAPARDVVILKSRPSVTVLLDRNGDVSLKKESFEIQKGDAFTIEITLTTPMHITAGLLEDSGKWFPFFDSVYLTKGTHRPTNDLNVDDTPSSARIIAGCPQAVKTALRTKSFDRVTMIRILAPKKRSFSDSNN